jgi:hypothetical protein
MYKFYKAPQNSRQYNPNFTKELERDINNLSDSYPNSEFLIMGDWNSRIGTKQVDLPHFFDITGILVVITGILVVITGILVVITGILVVITGILVVITGMGVGKVRTQCVMHREES